MQEQFRRSHFIAKILCLSVSSFPVVKRHDEAAGDNGDCYPFDKQRLTLCVETSIRREYPPVAGEFQFLPENQRFDRFALEAVLPYARSVIYNLPCTGHGPSVPHLTRI